MPKNRTASDKYDLFHASEDYFLTSLRYGRGTTVREIQHAFLQNYQLVHCFELPTLERQKQLETIFNESQNIDASWKKDMNCRSTSVGDVIRIRQHHWIVAAEGFDYGWQSQ